MRVRMMMTVAVAAMGLAVAGCHSGGSSPLTGDGVGALGATVRVNPNPAAPWAAYFTLQGGKAAHVLTGVSVTGAERAEIHESKMEGGLMTMAPINRLEIPAGAEVVFRSGGKHVMLFGVSDAARRAGRLTITLHFDGGADLPVELAFPPQTGDAVSGATSAVAPAATPAQAPVAVSPEQAHSGH